MTKFNFNEIYEKSNNNLGFNLIVKYIIILSCITLGISVLTIFPVNTLYFIVNMFNYFLKFISIYLCIIILLNIIKLVKLQLKIKINLYFILSLVLYSLCTITYIVFACVNIVGLLF